MYDQNLDPFAPGNLKRELLSTSFIHTKKFKLDGLHKYNFVKLIVRIIGERKKRAGI